MKKISIALCLFFMSFSLQAQALGDVNESGNIDIIDALIIAQYYVNIRINYCNLNVADVNCDNRIDIVDALLVTQYYLEIISVFSCSATPTPTPTPIPTPVPTETPEPTDPPGTGEVMINPELLTVSSGEIVQIGIKVNSGLHGVYHFEFGIFFDSTLLTVDTANYNNGVGAQTNTFLSSVDVSNGFIRITGDRIADEPYTWNIFYIFWIASPDKGGTSMLDLVVYDLSDDDNRTIGYPVGIPGYVEVTYVAPTPDPTATPTETPDPTETPIPTPDPTPTPIPENMTVALELPTSAAWGGTNHWIPNTGEDFGPFRVKITAMSSAGGNFAFTGDFEALDILSPLDDNFDSSETGDSNIKTNKGKCQYYLYAWQTNENPQLIKIFQLNSGIMNSAARYETVFSATGVDLKVGTGGYLYYDYNGMIYNYLTINAEEGTGTIRPGDDLRLRFGVVYYPEFNEKVGAGDFIAVYDKKLLDRAKEYCNNDAGISDWTRWNDGETVTDAVAYSWGCADSIADFNADLEEQRTALTAYYADTNIELLGENPDPTEHRDWSPWPLTIAPGNASADRWFNYLWGEFDPDTETYINLTINGTKYNPYMPGLSTWKKFSQGNYHDYDVKRSAGVDCAGFVQRCASYDNNPYTAIDIASRCTWGGGAPTLVGDVGFASGEYTWPVSNRNLLIPGDILVDPGSHVVIVLQIQYPNNTRTIADKSDVVRVIEATQGLSAQWSVIDTQSWDDLIGTYQFRRLLE